MKIKNLKEKNIWINWFPEVKANGKISKVPIAYNGLETGTNDVYKETWTTFENVNGQDKGIGFIIRDGICVIDIDNNNYDNPIIKDIVDTMDTYTEISPSGNGLHLLFTVDVSKIPSYYDNNRIKKLDSKYYVKNKAKSLECYIAGLTNRFMTYTGNVFIDKPIEERTSQLLWFLNKYMLRNTQTKADCILNDEQLESISNNILEIISRSGNLEKFKKLYNEGDTEDYNNDNSSADMALCSILAFYCGDNPELIDFMFSKSKLYREKWDRADYKQNTIKKAIDLCNGNFYNNGVDLILLHKFKEMKIEKQYKADDINIGKLFARMYNNKLRYNTSQKEWFFYNGKKWIKDEQGMNAINLLKTFVCTIIQYSLSIDNETFTKYCKKLLDAKRREALLKDSRSNFFISQGEFDVQDNLINCQNGTFNLNTFELQPHNPKDLLTKISNVIYMPKIKCSRWEHFIEEIMENNPNKINYLQKAFGYSLLAGNPLSKCFILIGTVRAGKGTLNESFNYMLGGNNGYAQTIMPNVLAKQSNKKGEIASPEIAKLQGCLYLSMSEPEQNFNLDDAFLKTLTGEDTISARPIYGHPFNFVPKFTLFINTNHFLNVVDYTIFESNRLAVIEFTRHFEECKRDTSLKPFFKTPEAISGIFNWAIEGFKKYLEEGLIPPQEIVKATTKYYHECDKLKLLIDNEMEPSPNNTFPISDLWRRFETLVAMPNSPYNHVTKTYFMIYMKRQPFYREKGTVNGQTRTHVIIGMKLK